MPPRIRSQKSPYHLQLREIVIDMYAVDRLSYQQISDRLGGKPCKWTVGKIIREYKDKGYAVAKKGRKGMQHDDVRKFDIHAWEVLVDLVERDSQARLQDYADEMEALLGGSWTPQDVSRALAESGFVKKRVVNLALEASPELQAKYRSLVQQRGYSAENYVFIDEVAR